MGKPIDFDGWLDDPPGPPTELAFWVRYWVAAHRFVLEHAPPTAVTPSYARLTERPEAALDPVLPRPALVPPGPHPRRDGGGALPPHGAEAAFDRVGRATPDGPATTAHPRPGPRVPIRRAPRVGRSGLPECRRP